MTDKDWMGVKKIGTDQDTLEKWYVSTAQTYSEKVLIYDLTKISSRVLKNIAENS
jgi:hypothetical protein